MKLSVVLFTASALVASAASHHHPAAKAEPMSDQAFVNFAAQTDMAEANLGQLAQDNGGSQSVKDLGQMMVTDHTADYSKLGAIATKAGLNMPKALDEQHIKMSAPLRKMKGKAFDKQYAHMMAAGHEGAIAKYETEAKDGQNADLKAYAEATLQTLHKHLDAAKAAK